MSDAPARSLSTVASGVPFGPAGTTAYSMSGPTASAKFVGRVHGVVVQASARTAVRPSDSAFAPVSGNVTVTVWSCRIL